MEEIKLKTDIIDNENLRLLSLFHYIYGGIVLFYSIIMLLQFVFISYFLEKIFHNIPFETYSAVNQFDPMIIKLIFYIAIVVFMIAFVVGILIIISAGFLKKQKYRIFSYAIAILNLISIPWGTILGIMTISVLSRDSVKEKYLDNQLLLNQSSIS